MIFNSFKGHNIGFLCLLAVISLNSCTNNLSNKEWDVYAGGNDRQAYSPLTQIDTNNDGNIEVGEAERIFLRLNSRTSLSQECIGIIHK